MIRFVPADTKNKVGNLFQMTSTLNSQNIAKVIVDKVLQLFLRTLNSIVLHIEEEVSYAIDLKPY